LGALYEDLGALYEDFGALYEGLGAFYEDFGALYEDPGALYGTFLSDVKPINFYYKLKNNNYEFKQLHSKKRQGFTDLDYQLSGRAGQYPAAD
jgi:hypothetical protein